MVPVGGHPLTLYWVSWNHESSRRRPAAGAHPFCGCTGHDHDMAATLVPSLGLTHATRVKGRLAGRGFPWWKPGDMDSLPVRWKANAKGNPLRFLWHDGTQGEAFDLEYSVSCWGRRLALRRSVPVAAERGASNDVPPAANAGFWVHGSVQTGAGIATAGLPAEFVAPMRPHFREPPWSAWPAPSWATISRR